MTHHYFQTLSKLSHTVMNSSTMPFLIFHISSFFHQIKSKTQIGVIESDDSGEERSCDVAKKPKKITCHMSLICDITMTNL